MSFSSRLVDFSFSLSFDRLPSSTVEGTKSRLLDFLGVSLAARNDGAAKSIGTFAASCSGGGRSLSFADGKLLTPPYAALVNGSMGHCLELDDEHHESICHIGAVVVPAALACAQDAKVTGKDLIAGIIAGYEAVGRIGKCIMPGLLLKKGFHPTGVVGVFGAALAASRVLRLDRARCLSALGIAGSLASGIFEFVSDGTLTKRLHPGWAAQGGVAAALLARNGLTGPERVLEGDHGFFGAYAGESAWSENRASDGWNERYEIDASAYKPYACCSYIHPAIDAALKVRSKPGFSLGEIATIEIRVHPETMHVIAEPRARKEAPLNVVDAQFSVFYAVAAALKHGSRRRSDTLKRLFGAQAIGDPDVAALAKLSTCVGDDRYGDRFPRQYPAEVIVRLKDGKVLGESVPTHTGDPSDPSCAFLRTDIEDRFRELATPLIDAAAQDRIIDYVGTVDRQDGTEPLDEAIRSSFGTA